MRRTGTVAFIKGDTVAIGTTDDGLTIIELLSGWDIDVGDEMSWANGYGLGAEIYENRTKHSRAEVFVQDHSASHPAFAATHLQK